MKWIKSFNSKNKERVNLEMINRYTPELTTLITFYLDDTEQKE